MDFNTQQDSQAFFDWENISDVEMSFSDVDDQHSDAEIKDDLDFSESTKDFEEEMGRVFYVGAKFNNMDDLRDTAKKLGKKFNCPIETGKSAASSFITLQCKHSGTYRKAKKVSLAEDDCENGTPSKIKFFLSLTTDAKLLYPP